jgi:hypothetical protein
MAVFTAVACTLFALASTIALQTRASIGRRTKIAVAAAGFFTAVLATFVLFREGEVWLLGFPFHAARIELKGGSVASQVIAGEDTLAWCVANFALGVAVVHAAMLLALRARSSSA